MPSGPAAFPDLRDLMAFMVSSFIGGLMLTSNSSSVGSMSDETGSGGLLRVSLKNYVHLALTSSFLEIVSPFLSLTARMGLLALPHRSLVTS